MSKKQMNILIIKKMIFKNIKIKLLILDVDGVMTDGTKVYDQNHKTIYKKFQDKDFTAIKRFIASGIKVVFLSGDQWNRGMAKKRNIDFYLSRGKLTEKADFIKLFEKKYAIKKNQMAYLGDDYFDLNISKTLNFSFCTNDAPKILKDNCLISLKSNGGDNVVLEMYDFFKSINY